MCSLRTVISLPITHCSPLCAFFTFSDVCLSPLFRFSVFFFFLNCLDVFDGIKFKHQSILEKLASAAASSAQPCQTTEREAVRARNLPEESHGAGRPREGTYGYCSGGWRPCLCPACELVSFNLLRNTHWRYLEMRASIGPLLQTFSYERTSHRSIVKVDRLFSQLHCSHVLLIRASYQVSGLRMSFLGHVADNGGS